MTDNPNKTTVGDVAHSIAKGAIGTIPIVGSLATEIFSLIVTPPLEKRRAEWMNDVAARLQALEDNGEINLQSLQNNEQFIDVVLQATTYALKSSEQEKIAAFKNMLLNTAIGEAPGITKSQIFLNMLDRFTSWHIVLLKFIDSPRDWFQQNNRTPPNYMSGSISAIINNAFPDLSNQEELIDLIWEDLKVAGFHNTSGTRTMMTGDGTLSERTTPLGKEFLKFISFYND
jgi:hypothetical protein